MSLRTLINKLLTNSFEGRIKSFFWECDVCFKIDLQMLTAWKHGFPWWYTTAHTHDDVTGYKGAILNLHEIPVTDPRGRDVEISEVELDKMTIWHCNIPKSDDVVRVKIGEVWAFYPSCFIENLIWNRKRRSFCGGKKQKSNKLWNVYIMCKRCKMSNFFFSLSHVYFAVKIKREIMKSIVNKGRFLLNRATISPIGNAL